jgi:hypothetical protein
VAYERLSPGLTAEHPLPDVLARTPRTFDFG